jgi:hypothetical protein
LVPVTRIAPRSFITNLHSGDAVPVGASTQARGIAFGGACGVARADLSIDGGQSWHATELGKDEGKYSFRQWSTQFALPSPGNHTLMIRCTDTDGVSQPSSPVWNPAGYMLNTVEKTNLIAA